MEIELEKTFLIKYLPENLKEVESKEILDIYLPQSAFHPTLRIRKRGDILEMTKKGPLSDDASELSEQTISLSEQEFSDLSNIQGKRLRKTRYNYPFDGRVAEIDIFLDDLAGLVVVDFEFESVEDKNNFTMPDFCLAEITQDEFIAGGVLAGKTYLDIKPFLDKYNYQAINLVP